MLMPADKEARWTRYGRVLTRAGLFVAAGILSWWFGASPAGADQEEDASAHDGPGLAVSVDDGASDPNAVVDVPAEIEGEIEETHPSPVTAGAANSAWTPPDGGVTAPLESDVAEGSAPAAPSHPAEPLVVPVLDAALPPVLAPVVRPVGATVDAIVAPVVTPVRDTVVTPIVDGVSESVVEPLNEAVTPLVAAVVEPATLPTDSAAPTPAGALQEAAEGPSPSTDVDTSPPMVREVELETEKSSSQLPRGDAAARVGSGRHGAESSATTPNPGGDSPVEPASPAHSSGRSASPGTNGEQVERSQRGGLLTARAVTPVAAPATNARARAIVAGGSQNSGSRPAVTPD